MKLCLTLVALMLAMSAFGEFRGKTFRYDSSYESFDRAIGRHYNWSESYYTRSRCGEYQTCFPSEMRGRTVYIEERIIHADDVEMVGATTRTTIYTDSSYRTPYVTYYTNGKRITHRTYHREHRFHKKYHSHHHNYWGHDHHPHHCGHHTHAHYYSYDFNTSEGKIITGLHMGVIALSVAADCTDLEGEALFICLTAAGGSALSASISVAEGLKQAREDSDLFREVEKEERNEQEEAGNVD